MTKLKTGIPKGELQSKKIAKRSEIATRFHENHDDIADQTDIDDKTEASPKSEMASPSKGNAIGDVKWNPDDGEQPDYAHLTHSMKTSKFELRVDDLESLIAYNSFRILNGLVVFGLRGARIVGGDKREGVSSIEMEDIRPNHRDYRCVIGIFDRETKNLWAYKASTVPNANAVLKCHKIAKSGSKNYEGNILPTGCYTYTVGIHRRDTSGEIKGVLRLAKTSDGASPVLALRSLIDVMYDRKDFWHNCAPADNIHPGRRATSFSSLGCLTLPGDYDLKEQLHSGLWADFRVSLGMKEKYENTDDGRQFSCVLLTARDAALAVMLRESGDIKNPKLANETIFRLRFGSQGDTVARLQDALGLAPDKSKLVGPVTREALANLQRKKLKWADGIYSPEMDRVLGLNVIAHPVT